MASDARPRAPLNWALGVISVAHILLGILYSVAVPLWEGHDEWGHFAFVRYLATERALPGQDRSLPVENDESGQPPLYYLMAALATGWIDTSDFTQPVRNPYATAPGGTGGPNLAIHTPAESFPYQRTVLAVHVTRLLSVLLSTVAVWLAYLCARLVFQGRTAPTLLATAIVAFWPQFLFVGSVVSNDGLVVTCAALALYFALRVVLRWPPGVGDLVGLGVALGLAALSKYTALGLLGLAPVVLVVLAVRAIRHHGVPRGLVIGAIASVIAPLVGGWWYLRNLLTQGDLTLRYTGPVRGLLLLWSDPGALTRRLHPVDWWPALRCGFLTFVGSFGCGNVGAPAIYYVLFAALLAVGGLGVVGWLVWRRPRTQGLWVLLPFVVLIIAPQVYLLYYAPDFLLRGRGFLALLLPLSILLALGLTSLLTRRAQRWVLPAVCTLLATVSAWVPFGVILPAYALPPVMAPDRFAGAQNPVAVTFGDSIQLLGFDLSEDGQAVEGGSARITFYWKALRRIDQDYAVELWLSGPNRSYPPIRSYPGRGNYATSLWDPGWVVQDTHTLPVGTSIPLPSVLTPTLSLLDAEGRALSVVDGDRRFLGSRLPLRPLRIVQAGRETVRPSIPVYRVGSSLALIDYEVDRIDTGLDRRLEVLLTWEVLSAPQVAYDVVARVVDSSGRVVVESRHPMGHETLPAAGWNTGDVIDDAFSLSWQGKLSLAAARLSLVVIDTVSGAPLLVYNRAGERVSDDTIHLDAE